VDEFDTMRGRPGPGFMVCLNSLGPDRPSHCFWYLHPLPFLGPSAERNPSNLIRISNSLTFNLAPSFGKACVTAYSKKSSVNAFPAHHAWVFCPKKEVLAHHHLNNVLSNLRKPQK
jgi:hypothetical protein